MMLKASLYNKMIYLIRQNRDSKIRDFNNNATKQMKQTLSKYHPKIHLVFLPTRSPELNLIEIKWWRGGCTHRQAINNSTFQNEQDIGW